jgi:hypothetical protein
MAHARNKRATRAQELSYWPAGVVLAQHTAQAARKGVPPLRAGAAAATPRCGCSDAAGAHTHLYRVRSAIVVPSAALARVVRRIDAPPTYRATPPRPQPRPPGARNAEAMPAPARQSSAATPRGWYRTYGKFVSGEAINKELQAAAYTHTTSPHCLLSHHKDPTMDGLWFQGHGTHGPSSA